MIGPCTKSSDLDLVLRIPASIPINNNASVLVVDIVLGHGLDQVKLRFFKWDVGIAPVDSFNRDGILNDT